MKKKLLTGLMIAGMGLAAQTPRLSLFEEFTGENCGPCAATNPGLNTLLGSSTNTPLVVAIKWQVPIPSAPTTTWSLYKTNQSEIDWRYGGTPNYGYPSQWTSSSAITSGINAAPTGLFDGQHQWLFGAASDHPAYVTNGVIATAQSYTSAFSVTMARAWDATFSSVNLTVNIVASANFTATGSLVFRTVMVEKAIHFATAPGSNGEKDFQDIAIKSFPSIQAGTPLSSNTWTIGQSQTFTLNCPLPSYARDKSEIAFVGFIQDDGNRKVAQAVRAGVQYLTNDAKAISATMPAISCTNPVAPQIVINNNGTNAITAMTITPYLDAAAGTVYNWTGSLAPGASTTIALNSMSATAGSHTFSYNISSVSGVDNNPNNNSASTVFDIILNYQGAPVAEGFEAATFPPANWSIYNPIPGAPTWIKSAACGGYALSSASAKMDFYSTIPKGAVNDFILPAMHFTATAAPTMSFDVAYAQYSAPPGEQDQLDVFISKDCGLTWDNVYSKAGSVLSTAGTNVTSAFVPSPTQWRTEVVTLTTTTQSYNNANVIVKFTATSDYGNNLYVDNVNLSQKSDPVNTVGMAHIKANEASVNIFPNPSNGQTNLVIDVLHSGNANITVLNALGQVVYTKQMSLDAGTNSLQIDVKEFACGIYNVLVDTGSGSTVKKLTVAK
jgi:hypothetical protein